jgi:hypothetical protein
MPCSLRLTDLPATGVDLNATEANVSKATLCTYFETKADPIAEYLRRRSRQRRARAATSARAAGS